MKVGIIGCGSIARFRHAPEYQANAHIEEIIFYDRNPERATSLADLFGGKAVDTVEELLEDPSIQLISDCSSNEFHHIFSKGALLKGKHVLCEKPISLTVEHAEEIVEAQKKSGSKLMIGHNQRFTKAHKKAKDIIASQELGNVLTFRTTFGHGGPESWGVNKSNSTWFFKKERSGLGVAGDLGIHKIDLIHYLLGEKINQVNAFQGALHKVDEHGEPIEVCDNIVCNLRTERGVLGTAAFSWTYYGEEDNSTIIYCERGMIKIYNDPTYQVEVRTEAGETILYKLEEIQTNDSQTSTGIIDAFIDSVRLDEQPPVTGEDGLSSLKVILAILEAAELNKTIFIDPFE